MSENNVHYILPELKMTFSNVLLCLLNRPKPKDIKFTMIYDKENHQLFMFEKLVSAFMLAKLLKLIIKIVTD